MEKITLFCLPFAGGNKYSYREFEKRMPDSVQLRTLEYPGRGARTLEPLLTDVHQLVEDVYRQMQAEKRTRYALYGHSMGGLVASLLARKLLARRHPAPLHIFVTGTTGPASAARGERKRHLLPGPAFRNELENLQGCPAEILQNEEVFAYFEPILRADFQASETYVHQGAAPMPIPFTVVTGREEEMATADIRAWQQESQTPIDFRCLPGTHFFIFTHPDTLVQLLVDKLSIPLFLPNI